MSLLQSHLPFALSLASRHPAAHLGNIARLNVILLLVVLSRVHVLRRTAAAVLVVDVILLGVLVRVSSHMLLLLRRVRVVAIGSRFGTELRLRWHSFKGEGGRKARVRKR